MSINTKEKVLIIGTGSIGERHLRCFLATQRADVCFCEPNSAQRTAIAAKYPAPGYASVDEALENEQPTAAVICTPAQTHLPIATQLLQQGMALLIEKPLALSVAEAETFLALSEGHNRPVLVAYVGHQHLPMIAAREALGDRKYGPIRHVVVTQGQNFPTFRPAYRDIYYARHETGGGAIQDALTHMINAAEWIAGPISRIFCDAEHLVLEGVEVEDTVNLIGRSADQCLYSFSLNQFQAPNETVLTFHCEKGSVRAAIHRGEFSEMALGEAEWRSRTWPDGGRDAIFIRQAEQFLDACSGGTTHLSTVAEALQTLKVQAAALQSSRSRQEIAISGGKRG